MDETLKYHALITELGLNHCCPFDDCITTNLESFRYIKGDPTDEDNFKPTIILEREGKKPKRRIEKEEYKCMACGISLYISLESAKLKYLGFTPRTKQLLGFTHIAKGNLVNTTGLCGVPDNEGHFTFFEYTNSSLPNLFEIAEPI
jgi:hypothetical protein